MRCPGRAQPYLPYIASFASSLYCNMRALQTSSVETVIVFRACVPMVRPSPDGGAANADACQRAEGMLSARPVPSLLGRRWL